MRSLLAILIAVSMAVLPAQGVAADDPLPSWNDGKAKSMILDFVMAVSTEGSPDYVAPQDRIATFDNDGTLWLEYPVYTQLLFAADRVRTLAPQNPEWKNTQPFQAVIAGDMHALAQAGMQGLMELIMATHAGMTAEEYEEIALSWLNTKKNVRFNRPYAQLIYQPMRELLDFLRSRQFKTFIVSGGGVAFMRPITMRAYGIPAEQVVGSRIVSEYRVIDGKGVLVRKPEIGFIDDKEGKPVGIYEHIGKRPILAAGNSDGDFEMLEYTTTGEGRRLGLIVHHTDAEREYAYDRDSTVGRLDRGLDEAQSRGWLIVSMKDDWSRIWPPE